MIENIPTKWIKGYVDSLLRAADRFGPETLMGKAALQRAEYVTDMVAAYKESTHGDSKDRT